MSTEKERPVHSLKEENLEASIWRNTSRDGKKNGYSVTISRNYTDKDGHYQRSSSFGERDLLKLSHLATKTHDVIKRQRKFDKEQSQTQEPEKPTRSRSQRRPRSR